MESYKQPFDMLHLGDTQFVHRGNCEFEIIRQPEGSFMQWELHAMVEGTGTRDQGTDLGRKRPCEWEEEEGAVRTTIVNPGAGTLVWTFREGDEGLLRFDLTLSNESEDDWEEAFVSVHNFPSPRLFRGDRTFIEADGEIHELRELWPDGVDARQGYYPFKGKDIVPGKNWVKVPVEVTAPMVFRIGGGNEPTPHACWCETRPIVAGMVCESIIAVLSNYHWPCLDLIMDYGSIPRGGSESQEGLIGIMEGTADDFLQTASAFTSRG